MPGAVPRQAVPSRVGPVEGFRWSTPSAPRCCGVGVGGPPGLCVGTAQLTRSVTEHVQQMLRTVFFMRLFTPFAVRPTRASVMFLTRPDPRRTTSAGTCKTRARMG